MNTTSMLDASHKFYNPNKLQTTNLNVYNTMYNAPPYQNLSNGQYAQNQYETMYPTPNPLLQQQTPTIASMTATPTSMAYQQQQQQPPPQPPPPPPHQQILAQDVAEKMQTYDESSESPKKNVQFVGGNHSNSGNSSSNSDDSNNDSDSSSNDSDADADKDDKENHEKMLVKPIRINLNSNKVSV